MANAKPLALCPRCSVELPHPLPDICPNPQCRIAISKPKNAHFASPDYLAYQYDDKLEEFTRLDRDKPPTPQEAKTEAEIKSAYREWCRDAHIRDRVAAMRDAHDLLAWIPHSDLSFTGADEVLRDLSRLAKKVGKLAESIDLYFASGGVTSATEVRPILPVGGDPDRRKEAID